PRAAVPAHVAGPRHRARHRAQGDRRRVEHDRGDPALCVHRADCATRRSFTTVNPLSVGAWGRAGVRAWGREPLHAPALQRSHAPTLQRPNAPTPPRAHAPTLPRVATALAAATLLACSRAPSPSAPSPAAPRVPQLEARFAVDSASVAFLIAEGLQRSHAGSDLEFLTDVIGPRLTGSPGVRRANEWTAAKLREYGADSVALEPWPFGISWQRGPLTMRLLAPHQRWLQAVSWAWAPGTNGPRAGDVVFLDATTREEFDRRFAGKLRGAWVLIGRQFPRWNPDAYTPADSVRIDSLRKAMRVTLTPEQRAFAAVRDSLLVLEGIAGR